MNSLKFQSVFDIIGPVMIGHLVVILQELFVSEKLSRLFDDEPTEVNSNYLILLRKLIVDMVRTWLL